MRRALPDYDTLFGVDFTPTPPARHRGDITGDHDDTVGVGGAGGGAGLQAGTGMDLSVGADLSVITAPRVRQ